LRLSSVSLVTPLARAARNQIRRARPASSVTRTHRRDRTTSGYLFDCMRTGVRPGFGLGAPSVAPFAAAHASVCGSHTACAGRAVAPERGEAQEGVCTARSSVALPARERRKCSSKGRTRVDRVVIGMDPHKRSVTIEVMAADETVLGGQPFGTDRDGYQALLRSSGRRGCGRSRDARPSARTWRTVCSPMARRSSMCRRSCRPGRGVSHRSGPQDRCHRCAFGGPGGHSHGRAAAGGQ
jgi:hypothetical protein